MAQTFANLTKVAFSVFTTLRAYALSRRMWLSIFIFVLSVIEVVAPMVRRCVSLVGSYLNGGISGGLYRVPCPRHLFLDVGVHRRDCGPSFLRSAGTNVRYDYLVVVFFMC